jgi:VWFA-related protein
VRLLSLPLFPVAFLSVCTLPVLAQTAPSRDQEPTPVFRANARAVLVDVVVTDSHGNPVTGLHQQDFKLTEDGKPQSVVFFEEHKAEAAAPIQLPTMPPNVFTNVPVAPEANALNVLLLDALDTPETDQSYVRAQVIEFLKTMKPGTPLAVFSLTTNLRLVQGFTGNPLTLLASLQDKKNGVWPETTAFSHSTKDDLDDAEQVVKKKMMLGGRGRTDAGVDAMQQHQQMEKSYQAIQRVTVATEALEVIARYLARIPGRKNLIWFASRFPMAFFPVASGNGGLPVGLKTGGMIPSQQIQLQTGKLKETADLLTVSRVAIYPVGARGVETLVSGQADVGDADVATEGAVSEAQEMLANYATMGELASETGGERISGTNDLSKAIAHAIDNGSHFYTLSYTPSNPKMDGQFRSIEVKIPELKYTLAYRKGYYALDSASPRERAENAPNGKAAPVLNPLQPLMMRGAPSSTEILYGARVVPEAPQPPPNAARAGKNAKLTGPVKRYAVDLMIRWSDVKLQLTAAGKHTGKVQAELLAYDRDGHALNWTGGILMMDLAPEMYTAIQRSGVPAHFEIDLPSDKDVFLATGVYDWETGKAGTLEIPIRSVSLAAQSSAANAIPQKH